MRAASIPRSGKPFRFPKPKGGYQLIPAVRLALAWWAYHEKLIRLVDLRVWFAAWEMRARRCRTPGPPAPPLRPRRAPGAHRAVPQAAQGRPSAGSRRRGSSAGRNPPSHSRPRPRPFPCSTATASGDSSTGFPTTDGWSRSRAASSGSWPAAPARPDRHHPRASHPLPLPQGRHSAWTAGRVKASWIADTFGVGLRRVKQARQELIAMGWLIPLERTSGRSIAGGPMSASTWAGRGSTGSCGADGGCRSAAGTGPAATGIGTPSPRFRPGIGTP